jgi:NDP-sugar pyrophosphorylase family protein
VMESHFGNGARLGVTIDYMLESEQLGTVGALSLLPEEPTDPVLVLNGDVLTTLDGAKLLRFHNASQAPATMCVRDHSWRVPYGVVQLDDANRYSAMTEKPLRTELVSAGINVLSPEAINLIPRGQAIDMPALMDSVRERIAPPAIYKMSEYWLDIGQVDDLHRAQSDVTKLF